jgi:hypothetical protein
MLTVSLFVVQATDDWFVVDRRSRTPGGLGVSTAFEHQTCQTTNRALLGDPVGCGLPPPPK